MSLSIERALCGLALLVLSAACGWCAIGAESEWASFALANVGVVSALVGAGLLLFARREDADAYEDASA